jgi:hypothetical protein
MANAYYAKSSDGRIIWSIVNGELIEQGPWGRNTYNASNTLILAGLLMSCMDEISQYAGHETTAKPLSLKQQLEIALSPDENVVEG